MQSAYSYAGSCSTVSGNSIAPREVGTLEQAITSNENGLSELDSCLNALESAMASVLRPRPPTATGIGGKALQEVAIAHSVSVERMYSQRTRIEGLINHVNSLREALEA